MVKSQAEVTSTYDIEDGLIQDGIKASDAKAIVKALIKLQIGTVATKTDVLELKHDISKLENDISKLEYKIENAIHKNNRFLLGSITAIGSLILVVSKILDKII